VGANLQPVQELFILAEPEHAPLVRAVAEAGWQADARDVHCRYVDEHLRRLHAIHAQEGLLDRSEPGDHDPPAGSLDARRLLAAGIWRA
jgi:leucyl aminopeptidase (aminopeptidase T)